MQRVVFKKLFLLSKKEEAAKEISLSPETTVVLGTNDTGKSSLIKSLYHTLGAHVQFHRKWAEANVIGVLNFIVNEKEYFLLRYQNLFGLFDQDIKPIYIEQGITKGIGIRLNNIFNFNLKLKHSSSKEIVNATPAFQYLPYYVDQDKGWVKLWSSFEDLTHFSGWHRDLIDYHIGIKPKEYYDLSENINSLDIQFKELSSEHRIIQNAQTKVKEKQKPILFDIDIDLFKKEIDRLLQICNKLNKEQENYRIEISNLKNQEQDLDIQLNIAQKSLSEIEKDYEFTLRHNSSLPIQCPTCGTDFENSLINRFSLVEDADSCRNLIIDINKRKKVIKSEISILQDKYNKKSINIEELNNLLIEKKGIIEFHDVIRSQSNKEINNAFNSSLEEIELDSSKLSNEINNLKKERNAFLDRNRVAQIKNTFTNYMTEFLPSLEVFGLIEDDYKNIPNNLIETGSDHPRALLAYYYSYLHSVNQFSSSLFFPIVIDSPNQQDQDEKNLRKIMNFALNKKPSDSQLILGSVELYGAEYEGQIINLEDKYHLLQQDEFNNVNPFVTELLNKTIDGIESMAI